MSFSEKSQSDEADTLVDTLTIDGATLSDVQLSALSSCDLQQLAELSDELHLSNEMDVQVESEVVEDTEEVIVEPELGAHEIEIETEVEARAQSPEEILPDIKTKTVVPPLRPLTIAPKPAKVPLQLKPVAGQQLLFLQSGAPGQAIKILSPQGQELNLTNIALGRPLTLKPAIKTIATTSNLSVVQPKQMVMKKVVNQTQKSVISKNVNLVGKPGQQIVVVQKSEPQIKLVQAQSNVSLPNPTKTITLQQAQEMGLLTGAKLVTQTQGKHTVVLNKTQAKTIKVVSHQLKSPTKILPAPQTNTVTKVPQRIILKTANTTQPVISASQIIQVPQPIASGQVHQINIPGKGVQYIKFVTASSAESLVNTSPSGITSKSVFQTPVQTSVSMSTVKPTNVVLSEIKTLTNTIGPKVIKTATAVRPTAVITSTSANQLVVVPSFLPQQPSTAKVAIPMRPVPPKQPPQEIISPISDPGLESNGIRPRKPCNCTKSQCLKLYCDCFANGEFCHLCNCMNCYNNIENEENRQRAIKNCLERNPHAFRPKIGKAKDISGDTAIRKHTKGCNCKRSGCLKNYCECYEAKIACSSNCKCMGCRNIEDSMDKKSVRPQIMSNSLMSSGITPVSKVTVVARDSTTIRPRRTSTSKQAFNFITNEVIEATSQCLLALSDNAEINSQSEELTKKQIIEEFGRCLMEIIGCSLE